MQSSNFSPNGIVLNWYDAAKNDYNTSHREELYKKTNELVSHLKNNKNDTKINALCDGLIKEFESHPKTDSGTLAEWIALNSSYESGAQMKFDGAYTHLHNLFDAIAEIKEQSMEKINPNIAQIDSDSLKKIEDHHEKPLPHLPEDIQTLVLSNLRDKDLLSMRKVSNYNRVVVDPILIERLNKKQIDAEALGISNLDELIDFFGENCEKITTLDLQKFSPLSDADVEKISKSFTHLKYLTVKNLPEIDLFSSYLDLHSSPSAYHLGTEVDNFSFLKLCTNLKGLNLGNSSVITELSFLKLCPHLTSLSLADCVHINDLEPLNNCPQLEELNLSNCNNISNIGSLDLPKLTTLNLTGCYNVDAIESIKLPTIVNLNLDRCVKLTNLNFLKMHPKLESLNLTSCKLIEDIGPLKYCKNLINLNLKNLLNVKDFNSLKECSLLKNLIIGSSTSNSLSFLEFCPKLTHLNFESDSIPSSDLEFFTYCQGLEHLDLSNSNIYDISFLKSLQSLTSLNLSECSNIEDFNVIGELSKLQSLNLSGCNLFNIDFLESLSNLKNLNLFKCTGIENFSSDELTNLETLHLGKCSSLLNLRLKHTSKLNTINLFGCEALGNIDFKEPCEKLQNLNLSNCNQIINFNFLKQCEHINTLNLSECGIEDFRILALCPNLTQLVLYNCLQINNIKFLEFCPKLSYLELLQCRNLQDITYLDTYPKLKTIDLRYCPQISDAGKKALIEKGIDIIG